MAADGKTSCGGYVEFLSAEKLYKVHSMALDCDVIVGIAGDRNVIGAILEHIKYGTVPDKETREEFNYDVLVMDSMGRCYSFGCENPVMLETILPQAVGSGALIARGAMLAGASPEEAVEIASQIDVYTGGKINVMSFED